MMSALPEPWNNKKTIKWCRYLSDSYRKWMGIPLIEDDRPSKELAQALYDAKFVLLSHSFKDVPRFVFANTAAQKLWGYTWDEFIGMASSQSAEPDEQEDREKLLARANKNGYIDDYQGIRIGKNGNRFLIQDVIIWNIHDEHGNYVGQAAAFDKFSPAPLVSDEFLN